MNGKSKHARHITAILLTLCLLVSALLCTFAVHAEETDELSSSAAGTYYFYGLNTNDPDFGSMSSPTGTMTYSASLGYYYYDITSFNGGDYCFVISSVSGSGASAVNSPAVTSIASAGSYYLSQGNYRGYSCMHLWNPNSEAVRIYFTSASSGLYAVPLSSAGSDATTAPTSASTNTPTTAPTTSPTHGGNTGSTVLYCENAAGWSTVYAYMWNGDGAVSNGTWPGKAMTNIGSNIWSYHPDRAYDNVIFSANGANQSPDLTFPGSGYLYNNATREWSVYDTSPLRVNSFTTDIASPQYAGTAVTLSASASGSGTVEYRFSVMNASGSTTVLRSYSTKKTAVWTPSTSGTYTLIYEFRDTAGNTNRRTLSYTIENGASSVSPYIKSVSPASGEQLVKGAPCTFTASAGGGMTGTNLLFYKYTLKNSSGAIVNVPYYTRSTTYSYTPAALGTYTLTVSVQGSDNTTVERAYVYTVVNEIVDDPDPVDYVRGDADGSGEVTILDATRIQRWLAALVDDDGINLVNADADLNGDVNILDATRIQRLLAGLISHL